MRNIRFPDLDITGMWVLAVGVFFPPDSSACQKTA